jgi:hypothetical protein
VGSVSTRGHEGPGRGGGQGRVEVREHWHDDSGRWRQAEVKDGQVEVKDGQWVARYCGPLAKTTS